jgi:hypothetical protein
VNEVEAIIEVNRMVGSGVCLMLLLMQLGLNSPRKSNFDNLENYAIAICRRKHGA